MFKKILSIVTIAFVVFLGYQAFSETIVLEGEEMTMFQATLESMKDLNLWVLLLLIPEQAAMYFSAAQIYFAFLKERHKMHISKLKLTRIALEINFVNHTMPSCGMSGLAYLAWRLRELKVSAGQVSFIHALRYAICAIMNTIQTFIAIAIVLIVGCVPKENYWYLWLAAALALGVQLLILTGLIIVRKQKNVDWVMLKIKKLASFWTKKFKKSRFNPDFAERFFTDMRQDYLALRRNKRMLWRPALWGLLFSFLELATYWVVGIAMGHPEMLPQIMIAEGVASVVGTFMITPGGIGGYEGAFIAVLAATGVDLTVATVVVITTRIVVFFGTIASGMGFYQQALLSRPDKFSMEKKDE
jgi:hypothetical protein